MKPIPSDAKFICGGETYAFGKQTIFLPVSFPNLPPTVDVEGQTLVVKPTFHVSLVCIGKIAEKYRVTIPDFENSVIKEFCEFTKEHDVSVAKFRDEWKFAREGEKRAVVEMCDVPNLDKFFNLLNTKFNLAVPYPPTHATIYTLQPNVGIFITDEEDIKNLTKPILPPFPYSLIRANKGIGE